MSHRLITDVSSGCIFSWTGARDRSLDDVAVGSSLTLQISRDDETATATGCQVLDVGHDDELMWFEVSVADADARRLLKLCKNL